MSTNNHASPTINVTPLIDVLLVLLIIFMVISPTKPHKYDTRVPEKSINDEQTAPPETLVVSITGDHAMMLNQTKAQTIKDLNSLLHTALDARPSDQKTVFIKGAPNLHYGEISQVIDTVKESGAGPIGLQLDGLN